MSPAHLSLRADAASEYAALRADYLAQLVAPADDMWTAFADMGAPHALYEGDAVIGCCSVDSQEQLLRFHVLPSARLPATEILRFTVAELGVSQMMVATQDPGFLAPALDVATRVVSHTLMYSPALDPEGPMLEGLRVGRSEDHGRIVDFQEAAVGGPREFLDGYTRTRLEREELILFEEGGELRCTGELRRDAQQPGISQLGLIVHEEMRGRGIGTRMMSTLVTRSRAHGLTPYCSTEASNIGAQRAIERAGMRANHRLLRVSVDD